MRKNIESDIYAKAFILLLLLFALLLCILLSKILTKRTYYDIQIVNDKMEIIEEYNKVRYNHHSPNSSKWLKIKLNNDEVIYYYNCKAIIKESK